MEAAYGSELTVEAVIAPVPTVAVAEIFVEAVYRPPGTEQVHAHELWVEAVVTSDIPAIPRVHDVFVEVLFTTGVGALTRSRAWTFDFDGHTFYVLDLGEEGTWVYDVMTKQWTRFETDGYDGVWNARLGVYWSNARRTVVSDTLSPYLYFIEPETTLDEEWRPITYVVTGAVEAHGRASYRQDGLFITASSGEIADPNAPDTVVISMRFSDDNEHTWVGPYEVELVQGEYDKEIAWLSLGAIRAPGRIFELTDTGGLIKLSAADAAIEGLDDGAKG